MCICFINDIELTEDWEFRSNSKKVIQAMPLPIDMSNRVNWRKCTDSEITVVADYIDRMEFFAYNSTCTAFFSKFSVTVVRIYIILFIRLLEIPYSFWFLSVWRWNRGQTKRMWWYETVVRSVSFIRMKRKSVLNSLQRRYLYWIRL